MFCGQCIQSEEKDRIQRFVFKKDAKAAMVGPILKKKKNKLNNDVKIHARTFSAMEGLL